MGIPQEREFDHAAFILDKYAFTQWSKQRGLETEYINSLLRIIERATVIMCTPIQRAYMHEYFTNRRTMTEIAEMYSVNKSTISRTISRGIYSIAKVISCMDSRFDRVVNQFAIGRKEKQARKSLIVNNKKLKGGDTNGPLKP